jgi:hypothetical protein
MTTAKKIEANRRNAVHSTGPRTMAGKARSRRNALKHGLAVPLDRDDSFTERIEALTSDLAPLIVKPRDTIRLAAVREIEVTRIQEAKLAILKRRLCLKLGAGLSEEMCRALAFAAALPDLERLARYERRAASKQKKFLRDFEQE